jgi:hypothetical protein
MKQSELIKLIIEEENPTAHFMPGFDEALIGTGKKSGGSATAVYDTSIVLSILIKDHNMTEFEALEHYIASLDKEINDKNTPIFINDFRSITNPNDVISNVDEMKDTDSIEDIFN